ncbi:MAG: bifunctional phosphoribosylaminoimidazolecarboxamide formyltransferase/IMP cyclohydrolase [Polyangiaceae bacterium]|nr:bifunctional phosphoribosylaminoimidazolecarboxamide formyltransferase/IMP cyclohydrolase [Polyangiaceae bacterium]
MPIARALLSVSDKTGLLPFARALAERGVELLSTGGTSRALREAGLAVTAVEDYAGSPEVMDGRVKTLHPRVHGGILARAGVDDADLARLGGKPIDLVVVNLYPFEATRQRPGAARDEIVENIDIGGPAMVRSAAKNHERVAVVCDPADYDRVLSALAAGGEVPRALRVELAAKAFAHTAAYDGAIAAYLSGEGGAAEAGSATEAGAATEAGTAAEHPRHLTLTFELAYGLRYGENPHQRAAFYRERGARPGDLALAESLGSGGKELSFNNLLDAQAAYEAAREFDAPAAVVIKHGNPCGVAQDASLERALRRARAADEVSAFGGVVALNGPVDGALARALAETFLECIVAPGFDDEALTVLRAKKNLRLLATGVVPAAAAPGLDLRRVAGGLLVQARDASAAGEVGSGRVVSRRAPTEGELHDLDFAWRVCKHVKSNAIVLARSGATTGVGAGQSSRVESVRLASAKAGEAARGSALASDAFFPFADGVEEALRHGIIAFVQPGGSMRDSEVIEAVDRAGAAMIFTGVRHFRH